MAEVVDLVRQRFYDVSEEQIRALIAGGSKKRFEIRGDKVRATYGHSFAIDLGGRWRSRRPSFISARRGDLAAVDAPRAASNRATVSMCT